MLSHSRCATTAKSARPCLTHHGAAVDASSGTGFYAEISSDFTIHINKDISFHADAYGHIWVDGDGPELAASADLSLNIPESAFLWEAPPCGIYVGAGFQIGKFSHGGDRIRGFKGSLDLNVCSVFDLSEDVFVDDSGNVHTGEGSNYTLIDAGNGASYLLARLGNGQVAVRRVAGLASPKAPGETDVPVTVVPGQTATLFNLTWRRGAPTLRLTAPDGTVYTRGTNWARAISCTWPPTARASRPATRAARCSTCPRRGRASGTSPWATCTATKATAWSCRARRRSRRWPSRRRQRPAARLALLHHVPHDRDRR